ncbi:hypothetical protein [Candidatus Odyssella thessalonicensis]|uniref:hypothetical protein n=1 Tax=Candidatus Odyssella thessalonicensis TaxID=84647 RepID=UPI000225C1B0|nr:hypothetical protein [Candidatus Odyssella thessalonicensis]
MIKKAGLILSIICSTAFSMETSTSAPQPHTLQDLRRIAHYYGAPIQESDPTVTSIIDTMKTANVYENVIACLESGKELLEMAISLEKSAQQKGCTLWWRYTNSIEADIATGNNKSFARTLLAGFINDGSQHFKAGVFGFNTACTYVYWANAHYFKYGYLPDYLKVITEAEEFVTNHAINIDTSALKSTKSQVHRFIKKQVLDFNKINEFHINSRPLKSTFALIEELVQTHSEATRKQSAKLYATRSNLSELAAREINGAINGALVALPLTDAEETILLRDSHNKEVLSYEEGVKGHGEYFHPRLTTSQLSKFYENGRLVDVYSQGRLLDPEHVKESFEQQLERLTHK